MMRHPTQVAAGAMLVLGIVVTPAPASAADEPLYRPATSYRVTQFGVSPTAEAIATGDFTGDGVVDVAMTDESAGGVFVLPGAGDGTLGPPRRFATGAGADAVSAGDLDADGVLDLVVSNGIAGTVAVLFGDGDGGFAELAEYAVGSAPGGVVIRDFDRDGRPDFAVAANPSYVFFGRGDRGFDGRSVGAGSSAVGIGAADLDGDGVLDLVVGDGFPARLQVLLGRGDGAFAAPVAYPVPGWVQEAFRVGDVNRDGTADVVAVNSEGSGSVLLGKPDGTLAPPRTFPSGWGSDGLEIADLNADGMPDLAINEAGSSELAIHLGDGSGRFSKTESHPVVRSAESVAVVDLNGDGKPDLVAAPFIGPDISVLLYA
jgi:hypothetical protein